MVDETDESIILDGRERAPVKTFTVPMHDVDRAITDGEEEGFVKIHVREGTDKILGAPVVARHAGEMIKFPGDAALNAAGRMSNRLSNCLKLGVHTKSGVRMPAAAPA